VVGVDTIWGGGSDFDSDRTRVFISHAAQPDPFADGLRRRLANRLAIDYDVLLDEDAIDPGDEWRSKLYRWLGTCEAAIILVNEAVIAKPDWVRFETHVVSWRREFSDDVVVIPVLLPGVTADDLQQIGLGTALVDVEAAAGEESGASLRVRLRTSPIELTAYQFVRVEGQDPDPDDVIDVIFRGLSTLEPQRRELAGPIGDWVHEVKGYLPAGRPLRNAAAALGVAEQFVRDVDSRRHDLRRELVAFALLFSTDLERVETATASLLRDPDFRARVCTFIPLVIPSWVGEQTALAIADVRSDQRERRVVAMDVRDGRSIADVIRRANCCSESDEIVEPVSSTVLTETSAGLERWYSDEVSRKYGFDVVGGTLDPDDIASVERSFCSRDKRLFVAVDCEALTSGPDERSRLGEPAVASALEWLRSSFPGALFVLNATEQRPPR
jgi:hypothetical protein